MKLIDELSTEQRRQTDEEMRTMHYMVGRALSHWVGVERQLTQTFHYAITAGSGGNVVRLRDLHTTVLKKAVNLRNRIDMVDAAVKGRLDLEPHNELAAEWKALCPKAHKLSGKRNLLAHRQVVLVSDRYFTPLYRGDVGIRLVDPFPELDSNDPEYIQNQLRAGLDAKALQQITDDFVALGYALYTHGDRLRDHLAATS